MKFEPGSELKADETTRERLAAELARVITSEGPISQTKFGFSEAKEKFGGVEIVEFDIVFS